MTFSKEDDLIHDLLKKVKRISHIAENEEKLKIECEGEFKEYFDKIHFDSLTFRKYEKTVGGFSAKRKDAIYGDVIVEYKRPGTLKSISKREKLVNELQDKYLEPIIKKEGEGYRKKLLGILFDGDYIIFVKWIHNKWQADRTPKLDYDSLSYFMRLLVGFRKKELDAQYLAKDFGLENPLTDETVAKLFKKLLHSKNKRVELLYNQWDMGFSYLYSGVFTKPGVITDLKESYGKKLHIDVSKDVADKLFFSIYTYYALIIKLLIAELLSNLRGFVTYSYIEQLYEAKNLKEEMKKLETGETFRNWYNVHNFLEGSFFSWYIDEWDEEIESEVRRLIKEIRDYEILTFEFKQEEIRDLLKKLYQILVPRAVRHDLGEYYTPDWLAEFTICESGYDGNPKKRLLDPACGSGTFPVLAIKRVHDFYIQNRHEWRGKEKEISDMMLNNIVGFDINPIAVLTSRANYLIAISRFLKYRSHQDLITLPIYLTNSVALPTEQYDIHETDWNYIVKTAAGEFNVSKNLVENRKQLEAYFAEIDNFIDLKPDDFKDVLKRDFPDIERKAVNCICRIFEKVHTLHSKNLNAIWTKIIDNRLAPLFVKKNPFDYIVGNPPWVNWEYLSEEYKKDLFKIIKEYGLIVAKGLDAKSGSVKTDISSIFCYVSTDIYLKNKGVLSFLVKPQFKNIAGEGFRKFNINNKTYLKVKSVHDLSSFTIFDEAGSETAQIRIVKGEKTTYPVDYFIWTPVKSKTIPTDCPKEQVTTNLVTIVHAKAEPINKRNILSQWSVKTKELSKKSILGTFNYDIRVGVYFGLNGIFFIEVIKKEKNLLYVRNMSSRGKTKIKQLEPRWIEEELVYPILKDRYVKKWHITGNFYVILPQKHAGENNEVELRKNYIKTHSFLSEFKKPLLKRAMFKQFFSETSPFYSIYDIGPYAFTKYKVVCASMGSKDTGRIKCVVVSKLSDKYVKNKEILAENTLTFVPCESEDEAHYICAILNSELLGSFITSSFSTGKTRFGNKLAKNIRLDKYNKQNKEHQKLVNLSKKAHNCAKEEKIEEVNKIEEDIELIVKKIYE